MSDFVHGIIHVHSHFSVDGFHSVADLADFARQSGMRFVGLTDHAEHLSSEDIKILQQECIKSTDESVIMIPGLEFRCREDIHILGIGATETIVSSDPVMVARHIQGLGGLAILAHPGRNGYQCPADLLPVLNGIEIWNAGNDGRFVPPMGNLRLLQEGRCMNPGLLGFGGADLHGLDQPPGILLQLRQNGSELFGAEKVLKNLRTGNFSICGKYVSLDTNGASHRVRRLWLSAFRKVYEISSAVRSGVLGEF